MKPYEKDWTDRVRDVANGMFVAGYLLLMGDIGLWGALFYLMGECFLLPHSIRVRSWSTVAVGSIFMAASIFKIVKILFF